MRLQCIERSCPFNSSIGFRTARDLRNHNQKYHGEKAEPVAALWGRARLKHAGASRQQDTVRYGAGQSDLPTYLGLNQLPLTPSQQNRRSLDPEREAQPIQQLTDEQMQLMLLEQQNKKPLLMARQEQESEVPRSQVESGSVIDYFSMEAPQPRVGSQGGFWGDPDQPLVWEEATERPSFVLNPQRGDPWSTERNSLDRQNFLTIHPQQMLGHQSQEQQQPDTQGQGPGAPEDHQGKRSLVDLQADLPNGSPSQSYDSMKKLHASILTQMRNDFPNFAGGWQCTFDMRNRVRKVLALLTLLRRIENDVSKCLMVAVKFEAETIACSPNKEVYQSMMHRKMSEVYNRVQSRYGTEGTNSTFPSHERSPLAPASAEGTSWSLYQS